MEDPGIPGVRGSSLAQELQKQHQEVGVYIAFKVQFFFSIVLIGGGKFSHKLRQVPRHKPTVKVLRQRPTV